MHRFVSIAAVLALLSCSSGDSGGLSPAARAKWNDYCAYQTACGDAPCTPVACLERYAESGPLIEFVDCQTATMCDISDDECTASAGTTDAERQDFTARCEIALNPIPATPCYIDPTLCTVVAYPLIRKEIMRAVDACLSMSTVCEDRLRCIQAAGEPLKCN